jgi:hypothetical protein
MAKADYATIIDEFARHVRKHFGYLESEYGFTACPVRTQGIDEPRDAGVSIRYKTDAVSIAIGISLIGASIGVVFKNEQWSDVPRDQRVIWVSLDSVIAFKTNGKAKTLLHELTSSRRKYWPERYLLENMDLAILTLASQVKQYATDIIGGDVSSFPAIAASG